MKCIDLISAKKVLFDAFSGAVSIIDYFEKSARVSKFPARLTLMSFCSFERSDVKEKGNQLYIVFRLNRVEINSRRIDVNFREGSNVAKAIINSGQISISEEGLFEIYIVDKTKGDGKVLATTSHMVTENNNSHEAQSL